MGIGTDATGEPGVAEDIGAGFAGVDHGGHLGFLLGEGVNLRAVAAAVPVGELGDPEGFAVFGEAGELGVEAVVIPVKAEVVDARGAAAVCGLVGGDKGIEPGDGVSVVGLGAVGDLGANELGAGVGGDGFVLGPERGGISGGAIGLVGAALSLAGDVGLVEDEEVFDFRVGAEEGFDGALVKVSVPEHGVVVDPIGGEVVGGDAAVEGGAPVVPPADSCGEGGKVRWIGEVVGYTAFGAFGGGGGGLGGGSDIGGGLGWS